MLVFDEINGWFTQREICNCLIVEITPDLFRSGYVPIDRKVVTLAVVENNELCNLYGDYELLKNDIIFSQFYGVYLPKCELDEEDILFHKHICFKGKFPYSFERTYEAINIMDIFKDKQFLECYPKEQKLSSYLKYTFGLEFETCSGYLTETICLRDGLIPLRDGSITGIEYTTIVLSKNFGLNLLEQQLKSLKQYTNFNKECSLHIHLGGFPIKSEYIFNVYRICRAIEKDIMNYVPFLTFKTHNYKKNGKDYCKLLPAASTFGELYRLLVGRPYFGSLEQPHPNDLNRQSKWNQHGRYYWCNLMNILCFTVNKTIEFRFLRPTYNYKKILLWLYILNAILLLAETSFVKRPTTIAQLLNRVYDTELCNTLINKGLYRLDMLRRKQTECEDDCGRENSFDDLFFTEDLDW